MITYLLYDLLPVWLARLGRMARQSRLYQLLAKAWQLCVANCPQIQQNSLTPNSRLPSVNLPTSFPCCMPQPCYRRNCRPTG